MSKFDQFLIVSDMDGTFFGEKTTILQNNLDAIKYFVSEGGQFTFATGRDYKVLEHQFPILANVASCHAVLCNGAYLYDFNTKEKHFEIELNKPEVLQCIQNIKKQIPEATFRISCDLGYLCDQNNAIPFSEAMAEFYRPILQVGELSDYTNIPWHKLVFSSNGMKNASDSLFSQSEENWIPKAEAFSKTIPMKDITLTTSAPTLLEFLPRGASKGASLEKLKSIFPNRTIICVGDYENDRDMLLSCDLPACPENALPEIKAISKIHLCHHREGCIADLIYKLDSIIKE